MNSSFFLFGKLPICCLILNCSFSGQSNLGCRSLLFLTLNVSCQSLQACKVSVEKLADSLMGAHFQVTNCFSLSAFKILSLSTTFGILILMYLSVGLLGFIFSELSALPGLVCLCPSPNQESFLSFFLNRFSIPSSLPSFRHSTDANVGTLMSQRLLVLSSFWGGLFLLF